MKFIFPQNYNFKNKLFGVIDYSGLILNIIWGVLVFTLVNLFFNDLTIKIFIFIVLFLPVLLFSIIGFNNENIVYIFVYVFKYLNSNKLYFYSKNNCNIK